MNEFNFTPATVEKIVEVSMKFFWLNRVWDNIVTHMKQEWYMIDAGEQVHQKIAHKMPLLADVANDILGDFDNKPVYLNTPEDTRKYASLFDAFQTALDELVDTNDTIIEAIETANNQGDVNARILLENFLADLTPIIHQHLLLRNKARLYPNDGRAYADFDAQANSFIIL